MTRVVVLLAFCVSSLASAQSLAPVPSLSVYAELGGPSALSAGLEVPVRQLGTSSVFVRGGVGFVPVIFGGGAIGTVPASVGLAVGLSPSVAIEGTAGGIVTFGEEAEDLFIPQSGAAVRFRLGRATLRAGAVVLVNLSPDEGDPRAGVLPSLALGVRL